MKTDWSDLTFRFDDEVELAQNIADAYDATNSRTTSAVDMLAVRSAPFLLSDFCSSIRSVSVSSSLSDMAASSLDLSSSHDMLNLEDIKMQLSQCCLTCGVCWNDEHFSFDCAECGGYSLLRPCINCSGTCGAVWSRDYAMSHASHTAKWKGTCNYLPQFNNQSTTNSTLSHPAVKTSMCGMSQYFPNDIRLEKLEIKS